MKLILAILLLSIFGLAEVATAQPLEVKKICHSTKVKKSTRQVCKQVKIHKKFNGQKIPNK
jgi:hypothetical protein